MFTSGLGFSHPHTRFMSDDDVIVTLDTKQLRQCFDHAENIVSHFSGKGRMGCYNHNTIASNLVGVKGELGVHVLLDLLFRDAPDVNVVPQFWRYHGSGSRAKGDIVVNCVNGPSYIIEVKSLRLSGNAWEKFSCCIPPRQLASYARTPNTIIVYALADTINRVEDFDVLDPKVVLKGWNFPEDYQKHGYAIKTICENIKLPLERMRPMIDLARLLVRNMCRP